MSNHWRDFDEKLQILVQATHSVNNHFYSISKTDEVKIYPAVGRKPLEIGTLFIQSDNIKLIHVLKNMFGKFTVVFDYTELDISKLHILATDLLLSVDGSNFDFILDSNRRLNKHKMDYIQNLLNKSKYKDLYEISQYYCKGCARWHQYIEYKQELQPDYQI